MHVMPHKLYKDPHANSHGGLENESQVVYQQHSGILEWAGRYALIQPDFSSYMPFDTYNHDNAANVDRKFRKESRHEFFVRETSMFRLHLNTLDSNVKFHYAILDNERDVVVQDSDLHESKVAFGMLTHIGHPDDALD